jgi:hypothetical protein
VKGDEMKGRRGGERGLDKIRWDGRSGEEVM